MELEDYRLPGCAAYFGGRILPFQMNVLPSASGYKKKLNNGSDTGNGCISVGSRSRPVMAWYRAILNFCD
jgi:hypothetical protein